MHYEPSSCKKMYAYTPFACKFGEISLLIDHPRRRNPCLLGTRGNPVRGTFPGLPHPFQNRIRLCRSRSFFWVHKPDFCNIYALSLKYDIDTSSQQSLIQLQLHPAPLTLDIDQAYWAHSNFNGALSVEFDTRRDPFLLPLPITIRYFITH